MEDSSRVLYTIVWGGGVVLLSIIIVVSRLIVLRRRRDRRSFRDFLQGVTLALVSFASSLAIVAVIIVPEAIDIRAFLVSVALGSFAGALIIMASDAWATVRQK